MDLKRATEVLQQAIEEMVIATFQEQSIDVDQISDLDSAIDDALNAFKVDTDNIRGLEDYVEHAMSSFEFNTNQIVDLSDAVHEAANEYLNHAVDNDHINWSNILIQALQSPELQAALDDAVRKSFARLLLGFLGGQVHVAQPVDRLVVAATAQFNQEGAITQPPPAGGSLPDISPEVRDILGVISPTPKGGGFPAER